MIVIFNWIAVAEFIISFAIGYVISKLFGFDGKSNDYIMTALAGIVLILIDLILRFRKVKATNGEKFEIVYPKMGGHIFFIPAFVWGFIWLVFNIAKLTGA